MAAKGQTAAVDIGTVIKQSGLPASTLHLWERHGLISTTGRAGLRRQYAADVFERIATIVVCQRAGFSLAEIQAMLDPAAFRDGKDLLVTKLDELRAQRRMLDKAIDGIEHAVRCPHPQPFACVGFQKHLAEVLPVERV